VVGWWASGLGGCGDDHDPVECLGDLIDPWPVAGQAEVSASAAAGEAGGDVQHLEPKRLGLGGGEVTVEGEQPQPGGQIGGHGDDLQPGLVDGVLPGRKSAQAGVFGGLDAVLDSGVAAVPCFQERQLPDPGVGGEGLVAPTVGLLQQRQLRVPGWGRSRRMITRIPAGQRRRSSSAVTSATSAPSRISPSVVIAGVQTRSGIVVMALVNAVFLVGKPTEYSSRRPRTWAGPVSQSNSSWVAPAPSARTSSRRRYAAGTWAMARVRTSIWSPA
jgi:hypothetical protein